MTRIISDSNIMINRNNIIAVSTTVTGDKISDKRRVTIMSNFGKHGINIILNEGITKFDKIHCCFNNNLKRLITFKRSGYDYGLICDDDFYPIDNFMMELNMTAELLPKDWRCLHLCPGFLWGRKFRDRTRIAHLKPEMSLDQLDAHESGRVFQNCDNTTYYGMKCWLGGPEAFIVRKQNIDRFIALYMEYFKRNRIITDMINTCMLNSKTFICREPQLGYEEENGGTCFQEKKYLLMS